MMEDIFFFGIEDGSGKILGVDSSFNDIDISTISSFFKNHFSPTADFKKTSIEISGKLIGVIYVGKFKDIPIVCTTSKYDLREGIYYKYPGQVGVIDGKTLISLLHILKNSESPQAVEDRKRSVRPILDYIGRSLAYNRYTLTFRNIGEAAKIDALLILSGNLFFTCDRLGTWVEKNDTWTVYGTPKDRVLAHEASGKFLVDYTDQIGTKYTMCISCGAGALSIDYVREISD